jgi:hypothetical protein
MVRSGDEKVPGLQRVQTSLLYRSLNSPSSQSKHRAEEIPDIFPGVQEMQLARFSDSNVPAGQGSQYAEPDFEAKVPEEQSIQPLTSLVPVDVNFPATQPAHSEVDVAVHVSETYLPGPHVMQTSQVDDCAEDWKEPLAHAFITPPMQ